MSKENDQPPEDWDEEQQSPQTFRNSYLNALNQNRGLKRTSGKQGEIDASPGSRASSRPRSSSGSASGGGRIFPEGEDRASQRPRPTRQIREDPAERPSQRPRVTRQAGEDPAERPSQRPRATRQSREEVESRLRQRPRPTSAAREQEEPLQEKRPQEPRRVTNSDYPSQAPRRASTNSARRSSYSEDAMPPDYDEYDNTDAYEQPYEAQKRRRHPGEPPPHHRKHRRPQRALSNVLIGCLGGLITLMIVGGVVVFLLLHNTPIGQQLGVNRSNFTQNGQQTLSLGNATQLIVKNQFGNVAITVSQAATSGTLTSVRNVQAASQDEANGLFKKISLTTTMITQGSDPACLANNCLLLTTTVPTTSSGGLLGSSSSASVDLTLTLPGSFNNPTRPNTIAANATSGNLTVDGFNGVLSLTGTAGNIVLSHTLIYAGSCLQTLNGNITVSQQSNFNISTPSTQIPCTNTTSEDDHFWYRITSGKGNLDLVLTSLSTNLKLDATVNNGTIADDFNLLINKDSGETSPSYNGPVLPNTTPVAYLYLKVSTGNMNIHKQ